MLDKIKGGYCIVMLFVTIWCIGGIVEGSEFNYKDVKTSLVLEFSRTHFVKNEFNNNKPSLIGMEFIKDDKSICLYVMKNSLYIDSIGFNFNKYSKIDIGKNLYFIVGCGLVSGYPKNIIYDGEKYPTNTTPSFLRLTDSVIIDLHVGIEYRYKDMRVNALLFGDCITMMIKKEVF